MPPADPAEPPAKRQAQDGAPPSLGARAELEELGVVAPNLESASARVCLPSSHGPLRTPPVQFAQVDKAAQLAYQGPISPDSSSMAPLPFPASFMLLGRRVAPHVVVAVACSLA